MSSRRVSVWTAVAVAVLAIAPCLHAATPATNIIVLGDSLSDAYGMPREAGWVARLDRALGPDHRVIDGSISGDTSAGALQRLDDLLEAESPDLLLVIIGGNDGLRGLSPDLLRSNLEQIVQQGRAAGARVMLMQVRLPPNLGPRYVREFEAVYPTVAESLDMQWVPFFLEPLFDRPGMLMEDGIHPTEAAQPLLVEQIRPTLEAAIEALER